MYRLLRANSLFSRVLLAATLLAWAGFALGAPGLPVEVTQSPAPAMAAGHCDGMTPMDTAAQDASAPVVPAGHGDCCHAGCQCLTTFSVVLTVPFAGGGTVPEFAPLPIASARDVPLTAAAPPLRPPIA